MSSKTTQSRQKDINWKTLKEWKAIGYHVNIDAVPLKMEGQPLKYHQRDVSLTLTNNEGGR